MISLPPQRDNFTSNAIVFVDYENISALLKKYGKDPLEIDFFRVIQTKLKEESLNIIDFTIYGNFERKTFHQKEQTLLRIRGLQTRHTSNNGKNSGDLELTVDAIRALYKNPIIKVFVIISSDRDIIPLLKAIKYENRVSYVLSTKNGFNHVVAEYADTHEYIEDIFHLTEIPAPEVTPEELDIAFDPAKITEADIKKAREVARYLYGSQIWKRSGQLGEPVSLIGYINVIARVISRFPNEILNDFKVAHHLKYITIYQDQNQKLCIKEGEKKDEFWDSK